MVLVMTEHFRKIAARLTPRAALWRDNRGTAMLEMTILAPVLLVIGLGVIEFGNLIFKRHIIENGIHDAARYIAGMQDCNDAALQQDAADIANYGNIDATGSPRVTNWLLTPADIFCDDVTATYGTVTLRGSGIGGPGNLRLVRIETTVNYGAIDLGFLSILNGIGTIGFDTLSFPVHHEERYYGTR